jgi:hypothetical protein
MMQEKAQAWINTVRNGHLHCQNVWFSLKVQFWPRIGYGLCSLTAMFGELENALHRQYYQILPLCGAVRTTPVDSWLLDLGFFGIGLPHPGVEALIAMSNKLLMHYGCNTATGRFMRVSYSLFYLDLGLLLQPMQESYQKYNKLVTHSWMKMLWEKISMFEIHAVVRDIPLQFPQEGDQFLMQVFIKVGYSGATLQQLNQVRIVLQVLFVSNVLTASGGKLSSEILLRRPEGEAWSNMRWPVERPTGSDMRLWNNAIQSICPSRSSTPNVGAFIHDTHRIRWWYWNETDSSIHHMRFDNTTEDIYVVGCKPNQFSYSHSQACSKHNAISSVQPTLEGDHFCLLSTTVIAPQAPLPCTFVEVLESWGNM